jgi:hypothetical protein
MNLEQALDYARAVGLSDREVALVVRQEADRVRFKRDTGLVTVTHPDPYIADTDVHPDSLDQLALSGWTVKKTAPEPVAAEPTPRSKSAKEK